MKGSGQHSEWDQHNQAQKAQKYFHYFKGLGPYATIDDIKNKIPQEVLDENQTTLNEILPYIKIYWKLKHDTTPKKRVSPGKNRSEIDPSNSFYSLGKTFKNNTISKKPPVNNHWMEIGARVRARRAAENRTISKKPDGISNIWEFWKPPKNSNSDSSGGYYKRNKRNKRNKRKTKRKTRRKTKRKTKKRSI
jgi:hypothetical protein